MNFMSEKCDDFSRLLASKNPVPGGGGASAYVGALGIALGSMVGNLTLGNKKYQNVEPDIKVLLKKSEDLRIKLTEFVEEDAKVFEPLSKAYGLPKTTEEEKKNKAFILENELKNACEVPVKIMECCCEAIDLLEEYSIKGTRIAISDVGVGAAFCKSAFLGASLNVFINTKLMKNLQRKNDFNIMAQDMLDKYIEKADRIYKKVEVSLRGEVNG